MDIKYERMGACHLGQMNKRGVDQTKFGERWGNVVIIPKGSECPEAKPRDSNYPRVLFLLVNDT